MQDKEAQQAVEELVKLVASQLDAGIPREYIMEKLSETGLDPREAQQLIEYVESLRHKAYEYEAHQQAGSKDLMWGFLLLLGGAGITFGTWAAAGPGGSYWVMWGVMVFGAFYILRGLYRKVTSATNAGERLGWVLGGVILIGGILGGGMAVGNIMNPPELTPPSESFIVWDDSSFWEDETQGIFSLSGAVTNTHSEWSIKEVVIEIEETDETNSTIKTYVVSVMPGTIPPGGKEVYLERLQTLYSCVSVNYWLTWEWVPP